MYEKYARPLNLSVVLTGTGYGEWTHTRMSEFVSLQVVTLEKPHVTHGTRKRLHPYTHTEHKIISYPAYQTAQEKKRWDREKKS